MNFRDIGIVLRKELRETLRDRRTLAIMILFPLVVYPLVSLLLAGVIGDKQAAEEARTSRIAIVASSAAASDEAALAAVADVRARVGGAGTRLDIVTPRQASPDEVASGALDAL